MFKAEMCLKTPTADHPINSSMFHIGAHGFVYASSERPANYSRALRRYIQYARSLYADADSLHVTVRIWRQCDKVEPPLFPTKGQKRSFRQFLLDLMLSASGVIL